MCGTPTVSHDVFRRCNVTSTHRCQPGRYRVCAVHPQSVIMWSIMGLPKVAESADKVQERLPWQICITVSVA
ncbi:hypothetical protein J6590_085891 [Homalodisca vitripennis]|nr:hypothetical protein J6590_085891 [Homalodisca vitripennis]